MLFNSASGSKKSCQGCELPSDDIPDSTSNSRGHNNNTPSATNNNNQGPNSSGSSSSSTSSNSGVINSTNSAVATPNSTLDMVVSPTGSTPVGNSNGGVNITTIINADSSVASSIDDDIEETPMKIKKKDDVVSFDLFILFMNLL